MSPTQQPSQKPLPGTSRHAESAQAGRQRAYRLYPKIGPCRVCGNPKSERHHKDGNTENNVPDNIDILCRKHHMEADGRLARFVAQIEETRKAGTIAAAEKRKLQTHCKFNHLLSGENLVITSTTGARGCRECRKRHRRNYEEKLC